MFIRPELRAGCLLLLAAVGGRPDATPQQVLAKGLEADGFWTRVHAAEYLIDLHAAPPGLADAFREEERRNRAEPGCRVGRHRVLIRLGDRPEERFGELRRLAFAAGEPDRLHALETLGKLGWRADGEDAAMLRQLRGDRRNAPDLRLYAAWVPDGDDARREAELCRALQSSDPTGPVAGLALDGLRYLPEFVLPETSALLRRVCAGEIYPPEARLTAAELLLRERLIDFAAVDALRRRLPETSRTESVWCRILVLAAPRGVAEDALLERLRSADPELRLTAAWGLLKLRRRPDRASRRDHVRQIQNDLEK